MCAAISSSKELSELQCCWKNQTYTEFKELFPSLSSNNKPTAEDSLLPALILNTTMDEGQELLALIGGTHDESENQVVFNGVTATTLSNDGSSVYKDEFVEINAEEEEEQDIKLPDTTVSSGGPSRVLKVDNFTQAEDQGSFLSNLVTSAPKDSEPTGHRRIVRLTLPAAQDTEKPEHKFEDPVEEFTLDPNFDYDNIDPSTLQHKEMPPQREATRNAL